MQTLWLEAATKALVYAALLLAVGACSVKWLLLPRLPLAAGEPRQPETRLARLLLTATAILVAALLLRLVAHAAAAFGVAEALSAESLRVIALESRWGASWRLQLLAAAVAVAAALLVRQQPRNGWLASTAAVATCCATVPLLGHAAGSTSRVALHAIHVGAAGVWLGSLAAIVITCRPRAPFLRAFAPVALPAAALLAGSGLVTAYEYVGSLSNLWTTAYGGALSVKLALVGAVVLCGFLNWRHWRAVPSEDAAGDTAASMRTAAIEVLLAVAVVLVTALLTELEHP